MEKQPNGVQQKHRSNDKFTAKRINFQGDEGYMVKQYHNGNLVAEQFIAADSSEDFFAATGIRPEME